MIMNKEQIIVVMERFKKEHQLLLMLLYRIQSLAAQAMQEKDMNRAFRLLQQAKQDTRVFLKNLDLHADWEKEQLYPLLRSYCDEHLVPHAGNLLDTVEEDHSLAELYAEMFITRVEQIVPPAHRHEIDLAAAALNKTCCVLWDHFSREEELMQPVIERGK